MGLVPHVLLNKRNMATIFGKKLGMSQIFNSQGATVPVTLVEAGPCKVLQLKTKEKDGYEAVQFGFEPITKKNKMKKSAKGKEFKYVKEVRSGPLPLPEVGSLIDASVFKEGDKVDVVGISKGKGFQGGVKKWGFHGRNKGRGTKHEERTIGSVGAARPSEIWPGKHMPGRMGTKRVSVKNLKIVKVEPEKNLLLLKGAVPGRNGILLEIKTSSIL